MRYLLFSLLLFVGHIHMYAQTKPIAYKSHAGDMDFFQPDEQPDDDFGDPGPVIHKIIKLNDSTIVQVMRHPWRGEETYHDTIVNHHIFADTSKTWQEIQSTHYGNRVEFDGFESETDNTKESLPEENKKAKKAKQEQQTTPGAACPAKAEKQPSKKKLKKQTKQKTAVFAPISNNKPNATGGFSWLYFSVGVYTLLLLLLLLLFRRPTAVSR